MRHFIYPEKQYTNVNARGAFTVHYDHDYNVFRFKGRSGTTDCLTAEAAAMLAGFILSKQRAIVEGDTMAFFSATHACDAIPELDFAVISPERLATTKEQEEEDDDQDVKVSVTSPDPESAKRATDAFAAHLSNMWVAKDGSQPLLTDAQDKELRRLQAADAPEDLGLLHPDQERRLTALREAAEILGGRLTHDRLIEWAEWILDGNTPTN